jgi:hypothetical protein
MVSTDIALLTNVFVGAMAGFWCLIFIPPKYFWVEVEVVYGFILGCLGEYFGSKIATNILVVGVPMWM